MFIINWGELDGRVDPLYNSKYLSGFINKLQFRKAKIKNVALYLSNGFAAGKENQSTSESGIIQIRPTNIDSNGNFKFEKNILVDAVSPSNLLSYGEVLFNNTNSQELVGKTAYWNIQGVFCCSNHITRIKTTDEVNPEYLKEVMSFYQMNKIFFYLCTNWNNQSGINSYVLGNLLIPIPSQPIQQQIVDIMNAAYTEKQQKEKEAQELLDSINGFLLGELGIAMPLEEDNTLESRKFCTNSSDVLGGRFDPFYYKPIFDKYDEELNDGKYTVCKLGKYIHYITYGASVDNSYQEAGIPLLRIKDLTPNEINSDDIVYLPLDMEKELRTSRVNLDDLLITRSGTIGVCSVVDKKHSGFAFGSFMIKFTLFCINPQYVSYYVNSIIGQEYFGRNKIGAIQGNITIPTIKSLPIPIPDPHIQTQIVEKINFIRSDAKKLEQEADDAVKSAKAKVEKILLEGSL